MALTLDSTLPDLSFAAASGSAYERQVLQGRDRPLALQPLDGAGAAPTVPADGKLTLASAIQAAEDVAAGRGGLMTASAVPEPRGFALMLAGLAVVAMLMRRRIRRED